MLNIAIYCFFVFAEYTRGISAFVEEGGMKSLRSF